MAGDPFKTVASGDRLRIPAPAWNELMSMARERKLRALSQGSLAGSTSVDAQSCVYIRNDSDTLAPQHGVLQLDGLAISAADNEPSFRSSPTFKGKKPTGATANVCITLEPIAAGKCGRALLCGLSAIRLDVADTGHLFAAPAANNVAGLVSAATGPARILFAAGGTGVQWAVVCLTGTGALDFPFKISVAGLTVRCAGGRIGIPNTGTNSIDLAYVDGLAPTLIEDTQYVILRATASGGSISLESTCPTEVMTVVDGESAWAVCLGVVTVAGMVDQRRVGDFDLPGGVMTFQPFNVAIPNDSEHPFWDTSNHWFNLGYRTISCVNGVIIIGEPTWTHFTDVEEGLVP